MDRLSACPTWRQGRAAPSVSAGAFWATASPRLRSGLAGAGVPQKIVRRAAKAMDSKTSVLMLRVRAAGNHASAFRYGAPDVLELNCGVADSEAVAEHGIQALQNSVAGRRRDVLDQGMTAQRVGARSQAPDVQVVHIEHARDLAHGGTYRL